MTNIDDPTPGFTSFAATIAAHARARPADVAFHVEGQALAWQALHRHVTQVAHALVRSGIAPG
ncbi:MAG TPA: hypothetical protein VNB23_04780, partial [Ramlibacter sp.]|nr:hypothetical protein [Ramlibacter sp.]